MSFDFIFRLSSSAKDFPVVFERAEEALLGLGFWRSREVVVSIDVLHREKEREIIIDSITREEETLRAASEVYMEFTSSRFGFGFQLENRGDSSSAGYIFISRRSILALHKEGVPTGFYAAIAALSKAVDVSFGYGAGESEDKWDKPEEMLSDISGEPFEREHWHDVLIYEERFLPNKDVLEQWMFSFQRVKIATYYFFINKEFLGLCRDFG